MKEQFEKAKLDSYCSGTGQLREGFLQSSSIVVLIQLNHFVRGTNFIKHILGHFAVRTGGLGEYHHTVLRHNVLKVLQEKKNDYVDSLVNRKSKRRGTQAFTGPCVTTHGT